MNTELYNTSILTLAAGIPHLGTLENPQGSAAKTARLCGSKVKVDLVLSDTGYITEFAQEVKACALGQAAAAILGKAIIGAHIDEVLAARDQFRAMVRDGGPTPIGRFSDLGLLAPVKDYPQRYQSALLPFEAVVEAVQMAQAAAGSFKIDSSK